MTLFSFLLSPTIGKYSPYPGDALESSVCLFSYTAHNFIQHDILYSLCSDNWWDLSLGGILTDEEGWTRPNGGLTKSLMKHLYHKEMQKREVGVGVERWREMKVLNLPCGVGKNQTLCSLYGFGQIAFPFCASVSLSIKLGWYKSSPL